MSAILELEFYRKIAKRLLKKYITFIKYYQKIIEMAKIFEILLIVIF